jgi:flagellin
MSLIVNNNLMAGNAARNLSTSYGRLGESVERLSTGLRVSSAADDAAGLAIRELMRHEIAVLNQGVRNISDAISMVQTAEGAMAVIDEKLVRMKELAEQAATGTYTTVQRALMDSEYQAMAAEIDRIATATKFNNLHLLDGSLASSHNGSGLKVHFGSGNISAEDYYFLNVGNLQATHGDGLRVGNSDVKDAWRTNDLDLATGDDLFAGGDTGAFGIQYSHDGGSSWQTYGWVTVDGDDTLSSVIQEINQGPQYTASLAIESGANASSLDGQTITINGNVLTFDSTASSSTSSVIGISGLSSASTIAQRVTHAINQSISAGDSAIDAVAVSSGATVTLYHEEFGGPSSGGELGSSLSGTATLNLNSSWTATTGVHLGARAVWQEESGYELELKSHLSGDNHQLRVVMPNGDVFDDPGDGTTLSAGAIQGLASDGSSYADDIDSLDEAAEWSQAANGSGSTSWAAKDILTQSAAQSALGGLSNAIDTKDQVRANLGAIQNRLENTLENILSQTESLQSAESRISDLDISIEMTNFTKTQVITQSAVAMLAQANTMTDMALTLLGGI